MNVKNVLFLSTISCVLLQGMKQKPIAQDILGKIIINLDQLGKSEELPYDFIQLQKNIYQENYSIMKISPRSALGLKDYFVDKINDGSLTDNEIINKMICFCINNDIEQ